MTSEDRRWQIVAIAAELFSQKGFRGTTTKEIAAAAGVNEAIIFRHFATKRELYTAIIDLKSCAGNVDALEAEVESLMAAGEDRRVFETIAHHILEFHDRDETFMRLLFYSGLEGHELSELFFRNHVLRHFRDIADYIKRRIADGEFRPTDAMIAARAFIGMVIYQAQLKKFYPGSLGRVSNRRLAERLADLFLSGTLAAAPPKATKPMKPRSLRRAAPKP